MPQYQPDDPVGVQYMLWVTLLPETESNLIITGITNLVNYHRMEASCWFTTSQLSWTVKTWSWQANKFQQACGNLSATYLI